MISSLWKKLFYSPYFFTIALREKKGRSVFDTPAFHADHTIPSTKSCWCADPIFAEEDGHTYLFFESVVREKGRIEVSEVLEGCSLSDPVVILEDEHHYSYPFVFQMYNQWYMIPESSSSCDVRLYKARQFPYSWEYAQNLLNGKYVDTTVVNVDQSFYLLTFIPSEGTEYVVPQIYKMHLDADLIRLEPVSWSCYDKLLCRGAGGIIDFQNQLYRPSQSNSETCYGNHIRFNRICSWEPYSEQHDFDLMPSSIFIDNLYFDGAHTYSATSKYEAIDIRCREFDFWKVPRTILGKIMSSLRKSNPFA